jgi:hypothetical protein
MAAAPASAQTPSSTPVPLALMPLPSSLTRGEGALTLTPAGGGPSTFTYSYGQTHDLRLEAAVRRDLIRLGRTCGGDEVQGKNWLADPQIAVFMKKKGYTTAAQLHAGFNLQLEEILKAQ